MTDDPNPNPNPPGNPWVPPWLLPRHQVTAAAPASQAVSALIGNRATYQPMKAQAQDLKSKCDADAQEVSGGDPVLYKRYFDSCMKGGA